MTRATSKPYRALSLVLTVVALSALPALATAAVTTYSDLASFLAAANSELGHETFDGFAASTVITDQVGGVVFSSPNSGLGGYLAIQIDASSAASSAPNMLIGGSVPGSPRPLQTIVMDFSPGITAFAFDLTAYLPAATPLDVQFTFDDETTAHASVSNTTGSEDTPVFFGAIGDRAIVRVTLTSGTDAAGGFEEFGIDDLYYGTAEVDTTPPVCTGAPATEGGILGIDGTAVETVTLPCIDCIALFGPTIQQFQSGIVSVVLEEGSSNVRLTVDSFDPGAFSVGFRVEAIDPGADGKGTVLATDGGGNVCTLPATFRALGPGPLTNQTICLADGLLFSVSNGSGTPAGEAACSANLPNGGEPGLPPGYEPSPPDDPFPCQVLTIDSPVSGLTDMTLKKDGDFNPDLRLLYSHSTLSGGVLSYPPFTDVTQTVDQIASITPDPTRIKGSAQWSPVKVTCATISEGARQSYCAGLAGAPGPDADGDGYTLCGSSTSPADCSDQRAFIHPGAAETCNGLDDNCDGQVDEGHPTAGAGAACTVVATGVFGACTHGQTSCADGPMTCKQTVFPVSEIACNGIDDDCDGQVDEAYVFSGFQSPINPDGSTVFVKKRGAIPVKFQLRDCSGGIVANAVATIEVRFVSHGVIGDEIADITSVGSANTGNLFRYDPTSQQYIYNLNASFLQSNAVYDIRAVLDDGTTHDVIISVK